MVLDVATGMGTFLAQLLEKCSADASIIGTDIDEKPLRGLMNKTAKAGTYPKLSLMVADAKHLCFQNNAFFTVSSFFGFDNVSETALAFKQVSRVLQDDGHVFFTSLWYEEGQRVCGLLRNVGLLRSPVKLHSRKHWTGQGLFLTVWKKRILEFGLIIRWTCYPSMETSIGMLSCMPTSPNTEDS